MHGAESVGDVDLRQVRQGLGKGGIVLGLAGGEAGVLQQHNFAGPQLLGLQPGIGTHHVPGHQHLLAQQL